MLLSSYQRTVQMQGYNDCPCCQGWNCVSEFSCEEGSRTNLFGVLYFVEFEKSISIGMGGLCFKMR